MSAPLVPLYPIQYEPLIRRALEEDLGRAGDQTTDAIIPDAAEGSAQVVARKEGRLAGLVPACSAFTLLDPRLQVEILAADGTDVEAGQVLARVTGPLRPILSAERTALNLLGRLSGIATTTRGIVRSIEGTGATGARIVCTRKTTPTLRALEKYAVRCGGGANHRFGLDDAILIKDNHRAIAGSTTAAIERARAYAGHLVKIEVEVDSLDELDEALTLKVDAVLLDNMGPERLREAMARIDAAEEATGHRALAEASGGITPETAPALAATGVDLLSVGWITHSAPSLDVALDV